MCVIVLIVSSCGGSDDESSPGDTGNNDNGGTGTTEIITVELVSVSETAEFDNAFGYYRAGENGIPAEGEIIWANSITTAVGSTFIIDPAIAESELGFFLIPHGGALNPDLEDGDDVTFGTNSDMVAVVKDNTSLTSIYQPGQIGSFFGFAPAFFTDSTLNSNGSDQVIIDGDTHRWEDLINGGDGSYNDLVVEVIREIN